MKNKLSTLHITTKTHGEKISVILEKGETIVREKTYSKKVFEKMQKIIDNQLIHLPKSLQKPAEVCLWFGLTAPIPFVTIILLVPILGISFFRIKRLLSK